MCFLLPPALRLHAVPPLLVAAADDAVAAAAVTAAVAAAGSDEFHARFYRFALRSAYIKAAAIGDPPDRKRAGRDSMHTRETVVDDVTAY